MSLTGWRLLSLIALVMFGLNMFIIFVSKLLRTKYNYSCREDKLVKTTKYKHQKYDVYEVQGYSSKFIDKYVIKHIGKKKELVCNYTSLNKFISYYILLFNKRGFVYRIMEINEYNNTTCSKTIKIGKKCNSINVVVRKLDDYDLGIKLNGEVSYVKVNLFSLFSAFAMFFVLFFIRHWLIEFICGDSKLIFLQGSYNIMSIVGLLFFALVYMIILGRKIKKHLKNVEEE